MLGEPISIVLQAIALVIVALSLGWAVVGRRRADAAREDGERGLAIEAAADDEVLAVLAPVTRL